MIKYIGRSAKILGTSKYIPEKVMTNKDFEKIVETNDQWIVERTGIKKRHFAAEDEKCSDLAYKSALLALEDAGISPEEIDMVIGGDKFSGYNISKRFMQSPGKAWRCQRGSDRYPGRMYRKFDCTHSCSLRNIQRDLGQGPCNRS